MDPSQPARKKRRLRAPTETVRERAVKVQEKQSEQPVIRKQRGLLRRIVSAPFRGLAWIGHFPPFKQIGHAIRWVFTNRVARFLGRILGLSYIRASWQELRLVSWPSRRQSRQLTFAVIIFSVIFGALIAVVDLGLNKIFKHFILK